MRFPFPLGSTGLVRPCAAGAVALLAWAADATAQDFEPDTVTLRAADVLPADALAGERHRVRDDVVNDGCMNRFVIESDYGTFEADNEVLALERIEEVYALERLDELAHPLAAAGGARESLFKRGRALRTLATHPVRTGKNLPRGVARYFGNYYRMLEGGRGELEEPAYKELIRYSAAKRGLAAYLGVNPYTSNPVLQDRMREMAWSAYGGGAGIELGFYLIPTSEVTTALEATTTTVSMSEAVRSQSPESLRAENKRQLRRMGIDGGLIRRFLHHPWYSPLHETALVAALRRMNGVVDRGAYIEQALTAESESDALFYQRTAEMLAQYHETEAPLAELDVIADLPVGRKQDGGTVLAVPADHVRWTQANAARADALAAGRAETGSGTVEVLLTGDASSRARAEFESRNFVLRENVPIPEALLTAEESPSEVPPTPEPEDSADASPAGPRLSQPGPL